MFIRLPVLVLVLALAFSGPAGAQERQVPQNPAQMQLSYAPIVKKVAPAVVNIYTKRTVLQRTNPFMNDPFFAPFFDNNAFGGRMRQQVENALGSGVIIDPAGVVITNAHVVKDADEITVVLADGREFEARPTLSDAASDLAVLRFESKGDPLPAVTLKSSESLEVGDIVLAIGNPFGVGQTVTSGIVSAQGRSSLNISDFNFFIQTDAAINPGNSGGPLVAMDGGVVGINTAIFSRTGGSLGIGFAIPSEMVSSVLAAEKAGVSATGIIRPWLGVTAQTVTNDIAAAVGLDRPRGALITVLHPASPLLKAGMKVGDVVLSINGKPVHDPSEMKFRMATVPLGESATMEAVSNGKTSSFRVRAMAPPDDPPRNETVLDGRHPLQGATIANLNPAVAVELGLPVDGQGVVVTKAGSGMQLVGPGDLLVEINGREIKTVKDVKLALALDTTQGWSFVIRSQGRTQKIVIR